MYFNHVYLFLFYLFAFDINKTMTERKVQPIDLSGPPTKFGPYVSVQQKTKGLSEQTKRSSDGKTTLSNDTAKMKNVDQ